MSLSGSDEEERLESAVDIARTELMERIKGVNDRGPNFRTCNCELRSGKCRGKENADFTSPPS